MKGEVKRLVENYTGEKTGNCVDYLFDFLDELREVEGAIVEFGVYRGGMLASMALWMRYRGMEDTLIGLDTFCGYPGLEQFSDTSVEVVRSLFFALGLGAPNLVAGDFKVTVGRLPYKIKLVFIDCDLYESYMSALNGCYDRMVRGGVIVFDEYYSKKYPGARVAVDEFFSDKPEKPELLVVEERGWERWCVRVRSN